jgi:hypothetical protein
VGEYMKDLNSLLAGNDLRSLGKSSEIIPLIDDQKSFDKLFEYVYNNDRKIAMKTIDVIEKATSKNTGFLQKHKLEIIALSKAAKNIEFKWHLAQLLGRIKCTPGEIVIVWNILKEWVLNKKESKIVRVNALQTLHDLVKIDTGLNTEFNEIIKKISKENIPSLNARIKRLS